MSSPRRLLAPECDVQRAVAGPRIAQYAVLSGFPIVKGRLCARDKCGADALGSGWRLPGSQETNVGSSSTCSLRPPACAMWQGMNGTLASTARS